MHEDNYRAVLDQSTFAVQSILAYVPQIRVGSLNGKQLLELLDCFEAGLLDVEREYRSRMQLVLQNRRGR